MLPGDGRCVAGYARAHSRTQHTAAGAIEVDLQRLEGEDDGNCSKLTTNAARVTIRTNVGICVLFQVLWKCSCADKKLETHWEMCLLHRY